MSDLRVGRINFETQWSRKFVWPPDSQEAQIQSIASGLEKLSLVIADINSKLDSIQKQLDKLDNRRWIGRNQ